jgi:hypothetical protein
MTELAQQTLDTKQCPICAQVLLLTEFGICRSRKDGHNLYCRGCIRKKVTDSRRALKAYKSIRDQSSKIFDNENRDNDELQGTAFGSTLHDAPAQPDDSG